MTVRSAWLLNPGQTRQDTRLSALGTMSPTGSMTTRSGLIPGGTPCTLTMSGMTATISMGRAVIQGTSAQGAYPVTVTVAEPRTLDPGHNSLDRIDTLWLVAYDQLFDTSGQTLATVVYTAGTPSAAPSAPAAPATGNAYLRLWDIRVPAGASAGAPPNWTGLSLLTDRRVYTTAVGGITPDSAASTGGYTGQYRDGPTGLERWNGSAWTSVAPAMVSSFVENSVSLTTNSTTYTAGTPALSTTCIVPPSRRVMVLGQAQLYCNTVGQSVYAALHITGSVSGVIRAAGSSGPLRVIHYTGDAIVPGTQVARVTGVAGETLTAEWQVRVTAGGAQIDYRNILLTPMAG
ncbi:hypothetical protein AB0O31_03135 [Kitasatospora cineracea]|uniref:hypothetical protein n=1 Tax=Kitasatospora cineracea TaxID=88074 RepID=UPI003422BA4C